MTLAAFLICFAGTGFGAAPAGRPPAPGLDFELVGGNARELRSVATLSGGLRIGVRIRDGRGAWYIASYRDRRYCRAVAGSFKLTLGTGLLVGSGGRFFSYTWRRTPPERHARISPSLSLWDRHVGAALSVTRGAITSLAAFLEKPAGTGGEAASRAALFSISARLHSCTAGAAVLSALDGNVSGDGTSLPREGLTHLFCSAVLKPVFAAGELDRVAGAMYGILEIGITAALRGNVKLFHAPDLNDIGQWDRAARNVCDTFSGAVARIETGGAGRRLRLQFESSVRNMDTRRLQLRSLRIAMSGRTRRRGSWEVECSARNRRETGYSSSLWAVPVEPVTEREIRIRTTLRLRNRYCRHAIRTDLRFNRSARRPDGATAALETRARLNRFEIAGKIQAWSLAPGMVAALYRPGVGSFEYWSMARGGGSDCCIRVTARLAAGMSLTGFCGKPWRKRTKAYTAICWKF